MYLGYELGRAGRVGERKRDNGWPFADPRWPIPPFQDGVLSDKTKHVHPDSKSQLTPPGPQKWQRIILPCWQLAVPANLAVAQAATCQRYGASRSLVGGSIGRVENYRLGEWEICLRKKQETEQFCLQRIVWVLLAYLSYGVNLKLFISFLVTFYEKKLQ